MALILLRCSNESNAEDHGALQTYRYVSETGSKLTCIAGCEDALTLRARFVASFFMRLQNERFEKSIATGQTRDAADGVRLLEFLIFALRFRHGLRFKFFGVTIHAYEYSPAYE